MKRGPRLAIDFGTTRTKVAYFDEKRQEARLVELGAVHRATIPSVFYIPREGEGEILVGDDAVAQIDSDPVGIVREIKRELDKIGKKRCGPGRLRPTRVELATALLKSIRTRCEEGVFHGMAVDRCTLTVPVAYTEQQRRRLVEAAEVAGFTEVNLMDEPTSAARAWLENQGERLGDQVVVCDIGGGTTDFSVVAWSDDLFVPHPDVSPDGFAQGGNDIDDLACDRFLDQLDEQTEEELAAVRDSLLVQLRTVKEQFARGLKRQTIRHNGRQLAVPEGAFGDAIEVFCDRLGTELRSFLDKCNNSGIRAPVVILVGGSSRIPGLKARLEKLAPQRTYSWETADYATVLGAVEYPGERHVFTSAKERQARSAYAETLKAVIADGIVTVAEHDYVLMRREQLELGAEDAEAIETLVLGEPLERIACMDETAPQPAQPAPGVVEKVRKLHEEGKTVEAIEALQIAINENVNVPEYFALHARICWDQQKYQIACSAASAALRLNPSDYESLVLRGRCYRILGNWQQAIEDFMEALNGPESLFAEATYYLANVLYLQKDTRGAERCLLQLEQKGDQPGSSKCIPAEVPAVLLGLLSLYQKTNGSEAIQRLLPVLQQLNGGCAGQDRQSVGVLLEPFLPDCDKLPVKLMLRSSQTSRPSHGKCVCGRIYELGGGEFACPTCNRRLTPSLEREAAFRLGLELALYEACEVAESADEWKAVELFDRLVRPVTGELTALLCLGRPGPAVAAVIVAAARAGGDESEVATLVQALVERHPSVDVSVFHRSPAVMKLPHTRGYITPQLSTEEQHGSVFNFVKVANQSPFRVTDLVVTARVQRSDGTRQQVERRWPSLDPGETHQWDGVFNDPGLLGANIQRVRILAVCKQMT